MTDSEKLPKGTRHSTIWDCKQCKEPECDVRSCLITDSIQVHAGLRIQEQSPDHPKKSAKVEVLNNSSTLWIRVEGYGDKVSQDGSGAIIGVELWEGQLRVLAYSDINDEDCQTLNMEKSNENNRIPD